MTREYIIETCRKHNIKNYIINSDLSIDVKGHVDLYNKGLTKLPLVFNIVEGNFYCSNNKLTSLKGAPSKCKNFYCHYNNLINLEGAPDECDYLDCYDNKLTTLKGAPKCKEIRTDYDILNLDNEDLYVIEALANWYNDDNYLKDYLKLRKRNELINTILDHE